MSKRLNLDRLPIDDGFLLRLMRALFPRANDSAPFTGEELVEELKHFGVDSRKRARLLLKKHRRTLIEIDRTPAGGIHDRINEQVFGEDSARRFRRTKTWFAYPALIRLALELEFGEKYLRFADSRDGIGSEANSQRRA